MFALSDETEKKEINQSQLFFRRPLQKCDNPLNVIHDLTLPFFFASLPVYHIFPFPVKLSAAFVSYLRQINRKAFPIRTNLLY